MADYQIIRVKKHSSMVSITSAGRHTFREEPTPNADASLTGDNVIQGASNTNDLIEGVKRRVGVCDAISKVKPVLAIEYMITASPEAFKRHGGTLEDNSDYFKKSMEWLEKKHGAQNIISSTLHLDEKTPHIAVFVVPVVHEKAKTVKRSVNEKGGGRKTIEIEKPAQKSLNAKHFLGGREKLSRMQDEFHFEVGSRFKLQRGEIGSSLKHEKMRDYYKNLTKAERALDKVKPVELPLKDRIFSVIGIKTQTFKDFEAVGVSAKIKALDLKQRHTPELIATANSRLEKAEKREEELQKREELVAKREKGLQLKAQETVQSERKFKERIATLESEKAELVEDINKLEPKREKGMSPKMPGTERD